MGFSKALIVSFSSSLLLSLATLTLSADPYFECRYAAENQGNFTANSPYQANLNLIVSNLSSVKDFNYGFHNLTSGEGPDKVFATALCAGDRTPNECSSCLNYTATNLMEQCPWGKEVVAWSHFCMVRYANRDIFAQLDNDPRTCVYNPVNASNVNDFNLALSNLLTNLSTKAASGGPLRKYTADNTTDATSQAVYASVQCTPDLDEDNCTTCLSFAMSELRKCCSGRIGCIVLRPACILRFETGQFYNLTSMVLLPSPLPPPPPPTSPIIRGKDNNTTRTVIIVTASIVGVVILAILSLCILSRRRKKTFEIENVDGITRADSLQFDFHSVLDATNNFSEANKLGQVGFGAVYKGQLPNGRKITVKRLSVDSGQGDVEFKNEVLFVAKLQHRNLVRLLGFCLQGQERLLIYDFVPNASLKHFIFALNELTGVESPQFNFAVVQNATNNFSDENKVGQGGFGAVYRGQLPNGQEVAVKRLSTNSGQGDLEFKNEVLLVAKLQHRNLVRLLGFCLQGRERLLIYEFVPNASLDHFIFDPARRSRLDWKTRYRIIVGIARGLHYLHEDSRLRIIHRDLKASNILLDAEMIPKIADFGTAKLFGQDETQGNTDRIVGTYGYMPPEYVIHGRFSMKSDVFSFGVLVLEIISGQKSNRFRNETNEYLINFAWRNWREGTALNLIDSTLSDRYRDEIMRCIHIGLLCVQENVAGRPTMASVEVMLNSYSTTLPVPSQPAFSMHSNTASDMSASVGANSLVSDSNKSRSQSLPSSRNEVSITELNPR